MTSSGGLRAKAEKLAQAIEHEPDMQISRMG
jgi:hypothetical protein